MNTAGAGTTREEVVGVLTKQCYRLDAILFPRQTAVVLQQDDALSSRLSRDGGMSLEVGIVGSRIIAETRRLDDVFQHATHITVDVGDIELTALHALDDLVDLSGLSGLHEVVTGLHLADGSQSLTNANPVGHDDALEPPIIAQDFGQQIVVAHRVLAIDLVVGSHDRPWVALADGNLKATQIDFTGSTLRDTLVDAGAVGLLRVHGEVLGRHAHIFFLYTVDVSCGNLTRYQRVFRVVLEVTAT